MGLCTRIIRNEEPIKINWGFWHLNVMIDAAKNEGANIIESGEHVMKNDVTYEDPSDGEILELKAGDLLRMWRD